MCDGIFWCAGCFREKFRSAVVDTNIGGSPELRDGNLLVAGRNDVEEKDEIPLYDYCACGGLVCKRLIHSMVRTVHCRVTIRTSRKWMRIVASS
jgi:hypothetical protein